jgi:hypothetical protein
MAASHSSYNDQHLQFWQRSEYFSSKNDCEGTVRDNENCQHTFNHEKTLTFSRRRASHQLQEYTFRPPTAHEMLTDLWSPEQVQWPSPTASAIAGAVFCLTFGCRSWDAPPQPAFHLHCRQRVSCHKATSLMMGFAVEIRQALVREVFVSFSDPAFARSRSVLWTRAIHIESHCCFCRMRIDSIPLRLTVKSTDHRRQTNRDFPKQNIVPEKIAIP